MPRFTSIRPHLFAFGLALCGTMGLSHSARAEAYAGAMIGLGIPMGTAVDVDNGMVYGATLGAHVLPALSVAATYLRDDFETTFGKVDFGVNQYLAEVNFFSLFFMNAGVHAGLVQTKFVGSSSDDLGFGFHLGFDFRLAEQFSIGGAGYMTWVTADDKYATLNLMIPLKFYF